MMRKKSKADLRAGFSLIELIMMISVAAILLAVTVKSGAGLLSRSAVRAAVLGARDAFAAARNQAMATGERTAVRIHAADGRIAVHAGADTSQQFPLGDLYRVTLEASRDSMAYSPTGLGWGASNLRLVVKRQAAAETLNVSRLGRVR